MATSIVTPVEPMHPAPDGGPAADALILTPEQARILGCLIEKARTTPADYPLSGNALMRAANQSTSRDPVVDYGQHQVEQICADLKAAGLLRFVHTPSGRNTTRYRQVLDERLALDGAECALVGLLLLRGPQTVAELTSRSERLHRFAGPDEVSASLAGLAARTPPLAVRLERRPGQKEARWTHLFYGEPFEPEPAASGTSSSGTSPAGGSLGERVAVLEAEVAELRSLVAELRSELGMTTLDTTADGTAGEE